MTVENAAPGRAASGASSGAVAEISLIICTRNRAEGLKATLRSIAEMRCSRAWELVVVDNGSTDHTADVIREFSTRAAFPVIYAFEPLPGLSRARNRGLLSASGNLIVFTDDDCYPDRDFLTSAVAVFADERIDYFGGRVLLYDPADYPITIKTSEEPELVGPRSFIRAGFVHGANLGFRRRLVESIGGFDETLGAGTALKSGEDVEFVARASALGHHGGYFPEPVVRHHHGRKESDADRLREGYDRGRGAYFATMLCRPTVWYTYAKRWYWSMRWRNRRTVVREVRGALQFCFGAVWCVICRRRRIPRIGSPAGRV